MSQQLNVAVRRLSNLSLTSHREDHNRDALEPL